MKYVWGILTLLYLANTVNSQTGHLYVDGKNLKSTTGNTIILRGVNAGIAEDGNIDISNTAQCQAYIDQIALTGANSIRFTWYTDGVSWRDGGQYVQQSPTPQARYNKGNGTVMKGYLENGHLGNIFSYCHSKNIIPILSIHDLTCANDWDYFNNDFSDWWTKPSVISFIQQHQQYMIINLANEMGSVNYLGGGQTHVDLFRNNYNTLIAEMRALGVTVPIMVDAPDCGQSSTELLSIAESMNASDPSHNLMFSAHGYWSVYAPNQAAVEAKLDVAVNTNACFLLGEVANLQAGPPNYVCAETDISALYPIILTEACSRNIGWMAWVWDQDCEPARKLSTNGQFNNLTPYGNDIVNNANYGLKSAGSCAAVLPTMSVGGSISGNHVSAYPNPASDFIRVKGLPEEVKAIYELIDLSGRKVYQQQFMGSVIEISLSGISSGFYTMTRNGVAIQKVVVSR